MKKKNRIRSIVIEHIKNNSKSYVLVILIFIIGIFFGIMFVNNNSEQTSAEMTNYFNDYISKIKNAEDLKTIDMFKTSLYKNIKLGIILCFFGTTVIRNSNSFRHYFI